MKSCRLVVCQNERMVGHFDISRAAALEDICVARSMLDIAGDCDCESLVTDSERRMLEGGPRRMRILMREACYRPITSQVQRRMAAHMPYPAYATEFVVDRISVTPSGRVLITIR